MDAVSLAAVPDPPPAVDPLRALIQSRLDELGWSLREAARHTDGASYETFSAIMRGKGPRRPMDRTLDAISEALRIPVDKVYAAAGLTTPTPWILPQRFYRIPVHHRPLYEALMGAELEALEPTERGR